MQKLKRKQKMADKDSAVKYPSAELIKDACLEDYKWCLMAYDRIYEKVNIALVFCGVILLVILSGFDYSIVSRLCSVTSKLELFSLLLYTICYVVSAVFIVLSVIKLLLMMRSKDIVVFDSIAARNEKIYNLLPDEAALWLVDNYTYATLEMRKVTENKHKEYNSVIVKIVISLLAYAIVIVINKGV